MNICINRLDKSHVKEAAELEKETLSTAWSEASIADCINNKNSVYLTASYDNKIIGICCFYLVADEVQLINLAIKDAFRGKGLGSALLSHMLYIASERGVKIASLEVETGNTVAILFYKKYGFSVTGIRKSFYPNGSDAFCMIKRL